MPKPSALLHVCLGLALFVPACSEKKLTGPTPTVTDAHKQDAGDENPRIMWSQAATPVTVTGTRFTPMAINTLSDKAGVKIPELYLVNATSSTRLSGAVWIDRQTMMAEIPAGIAIADAKGWEDFQIVARDPSGIRGLPGASFRVSTFEAPVVKGVEYAGGQPLIRFCDTDTLSPTAFSLSLSGSKLQIQTVEYSSGFATNGKTGSLNLIAASDTTAAVSVPAGLGAGVYDIRVVNADGQINTLQAAFQIEFYTCPPPTAVMASVLPRFIYRSEDAPLQVNGAGFAATPKLSLTQNSYAADVSYEVWLNAGAVQGFLARDNARPTGWYTMVMENPGDSTYATLANAVLVVDQPVPRIDSVTPDSISALPAAVTIRGSAFPSDVTVDVYYRGVDGAFVFFAATTSAAFPTVITATVPSIAIDTNTQNRVLVLRVYKNTSSGLIYGEYSNLVITSSSGNTGPITNATSVLLTPRTQFGLAGSRNGVGNRFLYAVGGRASFANPDTGTALATVEIAAIDAFGNLGAFYANPTTLGAAPRFGLGLVELDGWLYATGGSTATGFSNEIRKARVLDPRDAPVVTAFNDISGTLGAGNWLYQVTAVMAGGDAVNPGGESLASFEAAYVLSAAGGIQIQWSAVAGAVSYRIYRSASVNGASQSEQFLGSAGCCSFDDSGGITPSGSQPPPAGSLSKWTSAGNLSTARAFHGTTLARNAAGEPYLYVLGGKGNGGVIGGYEYSPAFLVAGNNLGTLTPVAYANFARYDAGVAVAGSSVVSASLRNGKDWLTLYAGCDGSDSLVSGVGAAWSAEVNSDGTLTAGQTETVGGQNPAAGLGVLLTNDRIFQFGGSTDCITAAPRNIVNAGSLTTNTPMDWVNPNSNGGHNLVFPRAYFGFARFNAQIFIVGGVWTNPATSTEEVTNTIESVFY